MAATLRDPGVEEKRRVRVPVPLVPSGCTFHNLWMTYRLHDSLGFRLSRASRIQERRLDAGLKTLGLTRITWCILLAVGNENLTQPSEIAEFVGIDRTAVSRALRQMAEDGLVVLRTGAGDARTREVELTRAARDRLACGTPMAEENNSAMSDRLGAEDVQRLKALLDRLIEGEPALDRL